MLRPRSTRPAVIEALLAQVLRFEQGALESPVVAKYRVAKTASSVRSQGLCRVCGTIGPCPDCPLSLQIALAAVCLAFSLCRTCSSSLTSGNSG